MICPFYLVSGILLFFLKADVASSLCVTGEDLDNLVVVSPQTGRDRHFVTLNGSLTRDATSLRFVVQAPDELGGDYYGGPRAIILSNDCFNTEYRVRVDYSCQGDGEDYSRTIDATATLEPIPYHLLRNFAREDYGRRFFHNAKTGDEVTLTCQTQEDKDEIYGNHKFGAYRMDNQWTSTWFRSPQWGDDYMIEDASSALTLDIGPVGCQDSGHVYCKIRRCPYHETNTGACNDNNIAVNDRVNWSPPTTRRCSIFGDPHFYTFDDKLYSYKGNCWYVIAMDKSMNWFVYGWFSACGEYSSCLESISIIIKGSTQIHFLRGYAINLGYKKLFLSRGQTENIDGVKVTFTGDRLVAVIEAHGVTVTYDGLTGASVVAPTDMPTLGLCGNNNGDASDDLSSFYDGVERKADEFGDAWSVGTGCRLSADFIKPHIKENITIEDLDKDFNLHMPLRLRDMFCRRIIYGKSNSTDAPLATVMGRIPQQMVEDLIGTCVHDFQYTDDPTTFRYELMLQRCNMAKMMEERATDMGICVNRWDNVYGCASPEEWRREAVAVGCVWTDEDRAIVLGQWTG